EGEVKQVVDKARGIEGLIRQPGVHAAGVIMSAEPLTDHIPVWTRHADGAVITQFDYPTCEGLGLLKMDFLGLRNLTIMADAVSLIKSNQGTEIDLLGLRLDDKPTYELLGQADLLRRAMGKKKKEILDKEFVPFHQGCRERGYSDKAIQAVWDVLVPFAGYAFNKAHSAAYGLVSYWTAYLKANYPAEYMAALLTSVGDDKDKSALYLSECRRMGIRVLPPDVNESVATFAPVGTDIRFGLAAIRNVGGNVVEAIIAARQSKGEF